MALTFFQFPALPQIGCVFSGRTDSDMPYDGNISYDVGDIPFSVRDSRFSLFSQLGRRGMRAWRELCQVHGNTILIEPSPTDAYNKPACLAEADGMMTSKAGLGLMIKTADCQPLLITDKSGKYIMALHVGWRGNRINFPTTAVQAFCNQYDLEPASLLAVRGPSLGPGAAEFQNFDDEWGPEFINWFHRPTATMDLWALTRHQLEKAGVPSGNIYGVDICTYTNDDSWFSYRRDNLTGRQASVIWIIPEGCK